MVQSHRVESTEIRDRRYFRPRFDPKTNCRIPEPCETEVELERQGRVVKLRTKLGGADQPSSGGGARGEVRGFSRGSRKRLIETCERLDRKKCFAMPGSSRVRSPDGCPCQTGLLTRVRHPFMGPREAASLRQPKVQSGVEGPPAYSLSRTRKSRASL